MLMLNHVAYGKVKIERLRQFLNFQFQMICWKMSKIQLPPRKCGVPLEMAMALLNVLPEQFDALIH